MREVYDDEKLVRKLFGVASMYTGNIVPSEILTELLSGGLPVRGKGENNPR